MATNILLVPISMDAFFTDGTKDLISPLTDFSRLPYYSGNTDSEKHRLIPENEDADSPPPPPPGIDVNGNETFLGDTVFRKAEPSFLGDNDTWRPAAGLHLHWALPDALTTQREDPGSKGKIRFPKVPNRWVVVLSVKNEETWSQKKSWVVESDYLYPDPKAIPDRYKRLAITFPIVPPDALKSILEAPVAPSRNNPSEHDRITYPFFYEAPFRNMGRREELTHWQDDTETHEYLAKYNPAGLVAIGYGHPLFSSVYSNCHSVFGLHDDLTVTEYPRRYDLIGWYDDAEDDCLQLFQNLPKDTSPWDALKAEYNWVDATINDELPALSVYYSRLELDAPLKKYTPPPQVALTVGNTATEALSAHVAQSLKKDNASQVIIEEQLEAISLLPKIGNENVDLAAKFIEARHDKGFKKSSGGSLWSVRSKSTGASAQAPSQDQAAEITLPDGFAHLLNKLNGIQMIFDEALNEIDSLRRQAFTDWYRFEFKLVAGKSSPLPEMIYIIDYSNNSILTPLQERLAATGDVVFGVDATGKATVKIEDKGLLYDVSVQYTLAQQLVSAIQNLGDQLDLYNVGEAATQAHLNYYLVRKSAPRYYQPSDPAILLEGKAVVASDRYGADGTLNCFVCTVEENNSLIDSLRNDGISSGAFNTILTAVDKLTQGNVKGFKNQTKQPWHPVSIEWNVTVRPEKRKTNTGVSGEGIAYETDFIAGTYELDVDAADLKLTQSPSGLEADWDFHYTGRAVLVSHAPESLLNAIQSYLMPLSLYSIKCAGLNGHTIDDESDYQYDVALFAWVAAVFEITNPPDIKPISSLTPAQLAIQKSEVNVWLLQQFPFVTTEDDKKTLIDIKAFLNSHPDWSKNRPVINELGILTMFGELSQLEQTKDPLATALMAYGTVASKTLLSQALSGFNDSLLTLQREFQLPVWDWRVVDLLQQKTYARDISRNLGKIKTAPIFNGTFLPIRSGIMQIVGLTIIDSFGQFLPLEYGGAEGTKKSERMTILSNIAASVKDHNKIATAKENKKYIYLPPRFAQETKLNFRWLSADRGDATGRGDEQEMNDHPATTPVCGWIVPNNLESCLDVYAGDGTALGSLVQGMSEHKFAVVWESAPGTNNYIPMSDIPNPHLYDFVANIIDSLSASQDTWLQFLENINTALQNIDPKEFAQHSALSLLVGRPMALVRAVVGLQAKGRPAVDQSTGAFLYDYNNNLFNRLTGNFENVTIPVRLGEAKQLNDGLVAYWIEDGNGGYINSDKGYAHFPELEVTNKSADALPLTISEHAQKITMLLDPRGVVHATSGVLPVKEISIPPDQYAEALKTLAVTFLTAPIITPAQEVQYPLPTVPGYGWSWLDRPTGYTWNRVPTIGNTSRDANYVQQRILEGWLILTPEPEKQTS